MFDTDDFDWTDAGEAGGGSGECNVGCGTVIFLIVIAIAFIVFGFWFLGKYAIYT